MSHVAKNGQNVSEVAAILTGSYYAFLVVNTQFHRRVPGQRRRNLIP